MDGMLFDFTIDHSPDADPTFIDSRHSLHLIKMKRMFFSFALDRVLNVSLSGLGSQPHPTVATPHHQPQPRCRLINHVTAFALNSSSLDGKHAEWAALELTTSNRLVGKQAECTNPNSPTSSPPSPRPFPTRRISTRRRTFKETPKKTLS